MSFGHRLKQAREKKKLYQHELATLLNITDGTISNYEKGIAFPRWDKIIKLCEILDVDPNYLFWDDLSDKLRNKIEKETSDATKKEEQTVIQAYREHPEMQQAIYKMLDIGSREWHMHTKVKK